MLHKQDLNRVVKFQENTVVEILHPQLPSEMIVGGSSAQRNWVHYSESSQQFTAGIWSSEPGFVSFETIAYPFDDFMHLLSGKVKLTDIEGHVQIFSTGDIFLIPKGWRGTWETVEPTRKLYAKFEVALGDRNEQSVES